VQVAAPLHHAGLHVARGGVDVGSALSEGQGGKERKRKQGDGGAGHGEVLWLDVGIVCDRDDRVGCCSSPPLAGGGWEGGASGRVVIHRALRARPHPSLPPQAGGRGRTGSGGCSLGEALNKSPLSVIPAKAEMTWLFPRENCPPPNFHHRRPRPDCRYRRLPALPPPEAAAPRASVASRAGR